MAKRKRKSHNNINRMLLLTCIIAGIATLVLRMINRRLNIQELGEVAGICGTLFVVCLLILVGTWVVKYLNKR